MSNCPITLRLCTVVQSQEKNGLYDQISVINDKQYDQIRVGKAECHICTY